MKIRISLFPLALAVAASMAVACCRGELTGGSLWPVATVTVPAAARFVAAEHFVADGSGRVEVPIAWLGANFKRRFLTKREEPAAAGSLTAFDLRAATPNRAILAELGERAETKLADLWHLLQHQPAGEPGLLLTNAYANIFYIGDADGVVWAVDVVWGGAGWEMGATPLDDPTRWRAGHQVVAR